MQTGVLLVVFAFTILGFSQLTDSTFAVAYFPPPLKQISDGVDPANVTCSEGLEIVLKKIKWESCMS